MAVAREKAETEKKNLAQEVAIAKQKAGETIEEISKKEAETIAQTRENAEKEKERIAQEILAARGKSQRRTG